MTPTKFGEGARIVIADSNPHLCAAMQESLANQGHPDTILCHSAQAMVEAVEAQIIDLLVLDDQLPGVDLGDLIRRIRRRELGKNPYVSIIATIAKGTGGSAKSALDAGVDELIPKPVNVERLFNRVTKVVQRRRPFVVSANYIGPTRRGLERGDGEGLSLRSVPNSLRSCIVDRSSRVAVDRMVVRAAEDLREDIFETAVRELDQLVEAISASYSHEASTRLEDWTRLLQRLTAVAASMREWYRGPSKQVVDDLARMLATLAQRIQATSPDLRVIEVDLLVQLNQAVPASLDVNQRDLRAFSEIAKIISGFTGTGPSR